MSEAKPLNICSASKVDVVSMGHENTPSEHVIKMEELDLELDYIYFNTDEDRELTDVDEQTNEGDSLVDSPNDNNYLALMDVDKNMETRMKIISQDYSGCSARQTRPYSNAERQRRYREKRKADKMKACSTFSESSEVHPRQEEPQHDVQINKPLSSAERQRKYRRLLREQRKQKQQMEDINAITVLSNTTHTSSLHQLQNVDQAAQARKRHLNKERQRRFRARQRFESPSTSSHQAQAERFVSVSAQSEAETMSEAKPLTTSSVSKEDVVSTGLENISSEYVIKMEEVDLEPDYIYCNTDSYNETTNVDEQTCNDLQFRSEDPSHTDGAGARGGRARRGTGLRPRAGRSAAAEQPVAATHEVHIGLNEELPAGRPLEMPLHAPKQRKYDVASMPSAFVKCEPQSPPASPEQHLRPHCQRDDDVANLNNYGSESDADSDDGENYPMTYPGVPRVFRSLLETPLDQDEHDAREPEPATEPDVPLMATDRPWSCYEFDWRAFPEAPIPPELRRETFSQINVGPTTPRDDPHDIFYDIWDLPIMEHIVSETNKYAQQVALQMLSNNSLQPRSRIGRWRDTTVDEMYAFFGLILAMGIVVKSRLEEYWSGTPDIFCTPSFSAYMSIDRFLLLSKCLHFADNDDMCALGMDYSEAKLFKILPIVSHLNKKFQELYTPAQNIALDESLLMWQRRLNIGQILPNEAAWKGPKTYEICESQTGYLWRFEVHAHKKTPLQQIDVPLEASTTSIVLRLTKGLENKGHTLWMDNFYNSPCLARRLKAFGFDCVGTLRTDRKFVPQALHSLTKEDMCPGEIAGLTSGDVDVMVWRAICRVAMISTYHGNGQHTTGGSTKPILISDYINMMGRVDKRDQLLAMYPVERKGTMVWYKQLFRRLLNVSVFNSYVIAHHSSPTISHRSFRINLINHLLSKPALAQPQPQPDLSHRLKQLPMGIKQRKRRACAVCKRPTQTLCVGCDKTVCMDSCFLALHSQ